MFKLTCVICICLMTFPTFSQSASKYEVATIMDVKTHQTTGDSASDLISYDVSVKVGDTIYVVLYTDPSGMKTVKYAAGRNLLVLVGEKTITYNDLLGRSLEVPIMNKKPATEAKQSK